MRHRPATELRRTPAAEPIRLRCARRQVCVGASGKRGLRKRLNEFRKYGAGVPAQAWLRHAGIGHHRVTQAVVSPLRSLIDDLGGCAGEQALFQQRRRDRGRVGQHGLFVEGLRNYVLHAGEVVTHRMGRPVACPHLGGPIERERFHDVGTQRFIDLAAAAASDHPQPCRGGNRHRISSGVGGGGPDQFQPGCVVLRPGH